MRILLDTDTLLELLLNRSMFIDEVEGIFSVTNLDGIEVFLSDIGLDKIGGILERQNGRKAKKKALDSIKEKFQVLKITDIIIQESRMLFIKDIDSSFEVSLAIKNDIWAIITHKPSDFSGADISILGMKELQKCKALEQTFVENSNRKPSIFLLEEFYSMPSHTRSESFKVDNATKFPSKEIMKNHISALEAVSSCYFRPVSIGDAMKSYTSALEAVSSCYSRPVSISDTMKSYTSALEAVSSCYSRPVSISDTMKSYTSALEAVSSCYSGPVSIGDAMKSYTSALEVSSSCYSKSRSIGGALKRYTSALETVGY